MPAMKPGLPTQIGNPLGYKLANPITTHNVYCVKDVRELVGDFFAKREVSGYIVRIDEKTNTLTIRPTELDLFKI